MNLKENAKYLRVHMTDAEARLWYHLRGHRFLGCKFKRQKPLGRYIVDFVCLEKALIIEIDGGQHMEQTMEDRQRDQYFQQQGLRVLRFWNNEVLTETEAVLERIRQVIVDPMSSCPERPSPQPSP